MEVIQLSNCMLYNGNMIVLKYGRDEKLMLEISESFTISKQITEHLKGKVIKGIEVMNSPHKFAFFKGDMDHYDDMLIGQKIENSTYKGGLVEIDTQDTMIFFGDGASPKYYDDPKKFPKKHQLILYFEDDTALAVSIQMYGEIGVFPIGKCDDGYYLSSSSKPSPLSDDFTYEYFKGLYNGLKKKMSVKAFLATEQRIPGLGNGVLQDILWNAGLDSRYDMKKMEETDFKVLYESIKSTISKMCSDGGRNTEKDLFGKSCGYVTKLSKNNLGEPCPNCGSEIYKTNYMGGAIYFCCNCQKR